MQSYLEDSLSAPAGRSSRTPAPRWPREGSRVQRGNGAIDDWSCVDPIVQPACRTSPGTCIANLSIVTPEDGTMNADVLKGKWKQLKGEVKSQWGQLTDDDLDVVEGD